MWETREENRQVRVSSKRRITTYYDVLRRITTWSTDRPRLSLSLSSSRLVKEPPPDETPDANAEARTGPVPSTLPSTLPRAPTPPLSSRDESVWLWALSLLLWPQRLTAIPATRVTLAVFRRRKRNGVMDIDVIKLFRRYVYRLTMCIRIPIEFGRRIGLTTFDLYKSESALAPGSLARSFPIRLRKKKKGGSNVSLVPSSILVSKRGWTIERFENSLRVIPKAALVEILKKNERVLILQARQGTMLSRSSNDSGNLPRRIRKAINLFGVYFLRAKPQRR